MKSAFTLIELLVVLAIISLLVGLLLPALASARHRAMAIHCLANMRTLGQAVVMYADDSAGRFPQSSHTTGNAFHRDNWVHSLVPYGAPADARRCPLDPTDRTTSFVTNDFLEPAPLGGGWTRLHHIPRPSATGFAVEADPTYTVDHLHSQTWTQAADMQGQVDVQRHTNASNVVYLDGHAAALPWTILKTTLSPARHFLNPETAR